MCQNPSLRNYFTFEPKLDMNDVLKCKWQDTMQGAKEKKDKLNGRTQYNG